jgi:photosystem II stability/assembly factor-like uncharacterized protein
MKPETMYKRAVIQVCLILLPIIVFPQWYWQNPLPQGNFLYSVFFTDSNNGYAVGDLGTIIKTTDGGTTWTIYYSGYATCLLSIFFTDNDTGYIAGQDLNTGNDLILKTTDAGSTWNTVLSGTGYGVYSIFFPTDNVGYGVGMFGEIVKTTDAGITWTHQNSGITDDLQCVYFTDQNNGYIGSELGIILKTNNGGTTWDSVTTTRCNLSSVFFTDANNGYMTGDYIYRTINAGVTWTLDMNGLGQYDGNTFPSIFFTDQNTGYVGDGSGNFFKTTNAGATWNFKSVAQEQGCQAMYFTNANTGYMIGGAEISQTLDGGSNWNQISYGTNNGDDLYTVFFPDESTGYAGGENGLFMKTTNGGADWSSNYVYCPGGINSLYFTSVNNGFLVGGEYMSKTTDGGTTWTQMQSGTTMGLNSIFFTNANTGYVVGGDENISGYTSSGIILKTTNAGVTWTSTLVSYDLNSVYFPDSLTGYAAGMDSSCPNGVIVKTTDGGLTWHKLPVMPDQWLYSVFFTNDNTGYAVGYEGVSLKTVDGGATWTSLHIPSGSILSSVFFITPSKGYVVDWTGHIFYTTDAGSTWIGDSSRTWNYLTSVFFTDSTTGYAVGEMSTILKKGYGGITSVEEHKQAGTSFTIYPNPANNEITTETGSTPAVSQLSIMNMNGQQLITRQITSPKTQIEISNLPSGVYFVRLTNDKTVKVGKFVKE